MLDRQVSLRTGVAVLVLSLLGLAGLVAFLLGGETGPPAPPKPMPAPPGTAPDAERADFLGDAACASNGACAFRKLATVIRADG